MVWALLIIVVSVLAGTLLALVPGRRDAWVGPVRTFALSAALSVVLVHLLPEALEGSGAWALLALLGGFFLPEWLGNAGAFVWRASAEGKSATRSQIALEASYVGLLIHQVGDGLGLGAFTGELYADEGSGGVITAIAAHAVPVVAIVVLTFDSIRGRAHAVARAVGLALASILGVLLTHAVPGAILGEASAWISAIVGGTLLHVVTHDLESQPPRTTPERTWDLLAGFLGIFVSFVGRDAHGHEGPLSLDARLADRFVELAIETGPLLVLGLALGAFLSVSRAPNSVSVGPSRSALREAFGGAFFGARLGSRDALSFSDALARRGAAPAFVVSFLLVTPELGFETLFLSGHFLGWDFAVVRVAAALFVAVVGAVLLARSRLGGESQAPLESPLAELSTEEASPRGFVRAFDDQLFRGGAWVLLGVVLAAFLDVLVPAQALAEFDSVTLAFFAVTIVAIPSALCAPAATPIAAVLVAKGLAPGAVLVGLLLGPTANVATWMFLRRWFGVRAAFVSLAGVVVAAWVAGALLHFSGAQFAPLDPATLPHETPLWLQVLALAALALVVRSIWLHGLRAWLGALRRNAGSSEGGGHSHGHSHGGHSHGVHSHGAHD